MNDFVQNAEIVPAVDSPNQGVQNDETLPTVDSFPNQMLLGTGSMGMKGIDPKRGNLGFLTNELGKATLMTLDQNFQA